MHDLNIQSYTKIRCWVRGAVHEGWLHEARLVRVQNHLRGVACHIKLEKVGEVEFPVYRRIHAAVRTRPCCKWGRHNSLLAQLRATGDVADVKPAHAGTCSRGDLFPDTTHLDRGKTRCMGEALASNGTNFGFWLGPRQSTPWQYNRNLEASGFVNYPSPVALRLLAMATSCANGCAAQFQGLCGCFAGLQKPRIADVDPDTKPESEVLSERGPLADVRHSESPALLSRSQSSASGESRGPLVRPTLLTSKVLGSQASSCASKTQISRDLENLGLCPV
ncbi:unnamed protein product [Symbiodinium natans]|uniref:Uncharacterized protein n=1 Tax=Symbiodinium natans TaxID=878477 RepID=A0A812K9F3_9DINO|nr:unnamed protein product [Symbiodinium natans]